MTTNANPLHDEIERLRAMLAMCAETITAHLMGAFSAGEGTAQLKYISQEAFKLIDEQRVNDPTLHELHDVWKERDK